MQIKEILMQTRTEQIRDHDIYIYKKEMKENANKQICL